jgi:type I restriction-modification system DNA methylase subunit
MTVWPRRLRIGRLTNCWTCRPEVRSTIQRLASTAIEVYFVERFVQLAKPGGMIAIIVPESILASDQLGALRAWLMEHLWLLAVVTLPQKVFTGVGANAKTGILFARRFTVQEQQRDRLTFAQSKLTLSTSLGSVQPPLTPW